MKNKTLLITSLIFVALMLFAYTIYPKLSEKFFDSNVNEQPTSPTEAVSDTLTTEAVSDTLTPETQADTTPTVQSPDFTVYDTDGNAVMLSSFFGKPIVINFWATWCGPCKSELPAFDSASARYEGEVVFLMVNLTDGHRDTVDKVKTFVENNSYTFPVYFDTTMEAATDYGVYSIPETVFINADGSLMDIRIGALSESALDGYIAKLIANPK